MNPSSALAICTDMVWRLIVLILLAETVNKAEFRDLILFGWLIILINSLAKLFILGKD